MKRNSCLALIVMLLGVSAALALTPSEWKYRQSFNLEQAGPIKFSLPLQTLNATQPDLRDLRLLGPDGKELPYLVIRPAAEQGHMFSPKDFRVELAGDSTVLIIETGSSDPLDWIELKTGATGFLKAVHIETSVDGQVWETSVSGVPVFRQDAAAQTRLSLEQRPAAFIRLTVDDRRSPPIAITGATLRTSVERPAPTESLTPRVISSDEFAGETVLTLDLGSAHLSLASLEIEASDPIFTRAVSIAVRELKNEEITERIVARDTLFRIALDGLSATVKSNIVVEAEIPSRDLIVHIDNGDSPPLRIEKIRAQRNPLYIIATPSSGGQLEILSGSPHTSPPRYDLAPLAAELNRLPLSTPRFADIVMNSDYRETDLLAGISLEGASLDPAGWHLRKPIGLTAAGVHQIELDLDVLASAQPDLRDLRLLRGGKQVPYILERTNLTRDLLLTLIPAPDPKRPSLSRWKATLPRSGIPLTRIALSSSAPLFERSIHVYETPTDFRGEPYQRTVASADWTRRPGSTQHPLVLGLNTRLLTNTLWIETDNGDNPSVALDRLQAFYPVNRLLAKFDASQPISLLYGNDTASSPRYDMSLIAGQLIAADRLSVRLGLEEGASTASPGFLKGMTGGVLFWAALAVVVILLLVVVAKLLPKPGNS